MIHLIYEIRNKKNSKIYVGAHSTNDENDSYMGSGIAIRNAIKKYGIENFEKKILYRFDDVDSMYEKEKEIVTIDFINRSDVYNMGVGGKGNPLRGIGHSDETKRRLSVLISKKYEDPEYRNRVKASKKGQIRTIEASKRYAETLRKNIESGKTIIPRRKPLTDDRKAKVGKKVSIDGVVYATQTIASRETGYSIAQIRYALKHNTKPDWFLL